jgi:hypothetical protein
MDLGHTVGRDALGEQELAERFVGLLRLFRAAEVVGQAVRELGVLACLASLNACAARSVAILVSSCWSRFASASRPASFWRSWSRRAYSAGSFSASVFQSTPLPTYRRRLAAAPARYAATTGRPGQSRHWRARHPAPPASARRQLRAPSRSRTRPAAARTSSAPAATRAARRSRRPCPRRSRSRGLGVFRRGLCFRVGGVFGGLAPVLAAFGH